MAVWIIFWVFCTRQRHQAAAQMGRPSALTSLTNGRNDAFQRAHVCMYSQLGVCRCVHALPSHAVSTRGSGRGLDNLPDMFDITGCVSASASEKHGLTVTMFHCEGAAIKKISKKLNINLVK